MSKTGSGDDIELNSPAIGIVACEAGPMRFDLIDFDGNGVDFDRSQLSVHNPIDRTLQGVCTQSAARSADRYAFAGLALTCRPDCCTLLPGTRYGYDNITLQRFVQSPNKLIRKRV